MASKKTPTEQEYDILNPTPIVVKIKDVDYPIYPLSDFAYQKVAGSIVRTTSLFASVASTLAGSTKDTAKALLAAMSEQLEDVIGSLIPDATAIVSSAIQKDEEWIQKNFRLLERIKILRAVIEAENIPELMGEFKALTSQFTQTQPVPQELAPETSTT